MASLEVSSHRFFCAIASVPKLYCVGISVSTLVVSGWLLSRKPGVTSSVIQILNKRTSIVSFVSACEHHEGSDPCCRASVACHCTRLPNIVSISPNHSCILNSIPSACLQGSGSAFLPIHCTVMVGRRVSLSDARSPHQLFCHFPAKPFTLSEIMGKPNLEVQCGFK